MSIKRSAILVLSVLFLLATSSLAQAGPRYYGSHHGYTPHNSHTIVIESHDYHPENHYRSYRHHQKRHHYNDHHRPHWNHHRSSYGHRYGHHSPTHIYVEKHVYKHEPPRVVYQQPQPTYYPPANNYSTYNNYRGDIIGDTLIGGALGAAAGAAIGAVTGNPAAGAQIGAVVGGFGGISRGILGRGLLW